MSGILYIVATPIGNLEDITLRAIKILSETEVILAEDTRVSKKLVDFIFSQNTKSASSLPKMVSYHQHSSEEKKLEILKMLMDGVNIALVTDAGTPGVSDPGNELVDFIRSYNNEIKIIPIPGASAVTAALSICGFNVSKFTFVGFLPKKKSKKILEESLELRVPVVFFESPYRIFKTVNSLKDLKRVPGRIFIAQELTKMHERTLRGSITQVLQLLTNQESDLGRIKGEVVVILEP